MKLFLDGRQADNRSGTGRYTVELARQLVDRSDVKLRAIWPKKALERDSWLPPESAIPCGVRRNPIGTIRRIRQIAREVKSFAPNIVHFPANIGPYWKFRPEPNSKVVVTLHDVSFLHEPAWFDYRRALFYRHAAARGVAVADRVVTDSSRSADDIMRYLNVPSSRLSVVPLGVGEGFTPTSPEEQSLTLNKLKLPQRFFLYYGTLEPRKNIERIVRAWSGIADRCEEDLVIAGRPGWKTGGIDRAIRESGFGNRIHICGFVESGDLSPLIGAARALVWPSLYEGFGLPVLEAMACGTPVLSSNDSSLQELVGDSAITVDPLRTEAIAEGMLHLAQEKGAHAQLRSAGLERARLYTWARCAERTLEVYREAMAT